MSLEKLSEHGYEKGQKVLYLESGTLTIVTILDVDMYLGLYDIIMVEEFEGFIEPHQIYTREDIMEMFDYAEEEEGEK